MIYLIVSASYHLLNEEINKIVKNRNYQTLDFSKTTLEEIVLEAGYNDLFNNEKVLVVKNCSFFQGKSDTKILEDYLQNPNELCDLIFTCDSVDERKKIVKLFKDKYHYINIKPLYAKEICMRLLDLAKKNGYTLKSEDANYITEASLNNYDIAYNNFEKIVLYYSKPCYIESDVVYNLTSSSLTDNNFKFVDAVIRDDTQQITKMLKDFKVQKIEPLALFNLLAREYRLMLISLELYNKNRNKKELIQRLHLQDWQVDKILKNAYKYTVKELENKLLLILDYDYKIKSGQIDKYLALEMFTLKND